MFTTFELLAFTVGLVPRPTVRPNMLPVRSAPLIGRSGGAIWVLLAPRPIALSPCVDIPRIKAVGDMALVRPSGVVVCDRQFAQTRPTPRVHSVGEARHGCEFSLGHHRTAFGARLLAAGEYGFPQFDTRLLFDFPCRRRARISECRPSPLRVVGRAHSSCVAYAFAPVGYARTIGHVDSNQSATARASYRWRRASIMSLEDGF